MLDQELDLAALIGSRICHDLISPIGAINNGVELLAMSGATPSAEMDLIGSSVSNASARIRFFRVAFGSAGEQMVGRAEITSILRDIYDEGRHSVTWTPLEPQPRNTVRLAFLALLCLEAAMPYGGVIKISESDGRWTLDAKADKLNINDTLWQMLDGMNAVEDLQPAQVQFALLPTNAKKANRKISQQISAEAVSITF
ncbi:histidine phosphotransferase ChpT [Sulfitobacter brevis]|uniref:Histidine phosphotransferase ChpT n=1 Tax=Sulfitobacter brevis TaxID=74348 RepID=A0A1I2FZV0_9RHOB|nr:histidine phosphotransferase family protein [Sulfitobacter brevis]SFF10443.1 histidine phosphotransferase ChpT [Sulfitobacter brevis]